MESRPRYHYVDLLRGLAALAVVITHYRWFSAQSIGDWRADAALPLYSVLWPFYENGDVAVRLFWALSGFVFVIAYGNRDVSARTFWVHRFSRLYPLHLLTLVVVAGLQALSLHLYGRWTIYPNNDLPHFIAQLFFASNWFTMEPSFNGPIWSVSIEVVIYFVFLLYLRISGLRAAIALTLGGAILASVYDSVLAQCLTLFFAGGAIALVADRIRNLLSLSLIALTGTAALVTVLHWVGLEYFTYVLVIYVGCPVTLAVFVGLDHRAPELAERWHWIGLSTYSTYLWHMPLLIAIKIAWGDWRPAFLDRPIALALWVATIAVIGVLSYRTFEAPAQRWIRRSLRRQPASSEDPHCPPPERATTF